MRTDGYTVLLNPKAVEDIQTAIDFYEGEKVGLGVEFEQELNDFIITLSRLPHFEIRYEQFRCLPLKRFPFMIHFTVDKGDEVVLVHAVLHTSRSPDQWKKH